MTESLDASSAALTPDGFYRSMADAERQLRADAPAAGGFERDRKELLNITWA